MGLRERIAEVKQQALAERWRHDDFLMRVVDEVVDWAERWEAGRFVCDHAGRVNEPSGVMMTTRMDDAVNLRCCRCTAQSTVPRTAMNAEAEATGESFSLAVMLERYRKQ